MIPYNLNAALQRRTERSEVRPLEALVGPHSYLLRKKALANRDALGTAAAAKITKDLKRSLKWICAVVELGRLACDVPKLKH